MLIDVRSPRFALTPSLLQHAESRTEMALGVARKVIRHVTITLDHDNAGGASVKSCRMLIRCHGIGSIVAESSHEDLYSAIAAAADTARREVLRRLHRDLSRERRRATSLSAI